MPDEEYSVRDLVSLIRGIFDDKTFEEMRVEFENTPTSDPAPWPNTCHPALSHSAEFIRKFNKNLVRIPSITRPTAAFKAVDELHSAEPLTPRYMVLARSRAWAPAPFVGDPRYEQAVYVWSIWMDDHRRHVSGDCELVFEDA